ncbi:MAG: serine hydrolase, partial [Methylomonas sp.]|nr:serine hydrolase [Methylomonas sp.]
TEFPVDPGIQSNYMHGHADYNCDGILSSYNGDVAASSCADSGGTKLQVMPAQEIISYLDPSASWAAGAMISNHDDLAKWMKAYVDGELINNKTLQSQMLGDCLPSAPDYGASYCLGVVKIAWPFDSSFTVNDPQNNDLKKLWYGHLGQINGYDNAVFRNASKNITIGMTNNNYFISTDPMVGTGILIFELLNIVDPQPAQLAQMASAYKTQYKTLKPLNPQDLGGQ